MAMLVASQLTEVVNQQGSPCVSLYMPIYRSPPEQVQNQIRYTNLLKQISGKLNEQLGKRDAEELTQRLASLVPFKPNGDGLAVLANPGFLRVYKVPRPVPELAVVGDSFYVKPLIRILQSTDRFQVIGISESRIRLLEGTRDALEELDVEDGVPRTIMDALPEEYTDPSMPPGVDPKSREGFGGPVIHVAPRSRVDEYKRDVERFFRVVDAAVSERYSMRTGLPLILAALPQHHAQFRSVSRNAYLLADAIDVDPFGLSADELRERAWKLLEPRYLAKLQHLTEEFHSARAKKLADDDLHKLAEAAVMSRVRTLLLDEGKHRPGQIDAATGVITEGEESSDIYDDLAELVLRRGGEVIVAPSQFMPTSTGIAGIYRF